MAYSASLDCLTNDLEQAEAIIGRRGVVWGITMAVLAATAPAGSSMGPTLPSIAPLLTVVVNPNKLLTSQRRQNLVGAVKAYCSDIKRVYPRNSPKDSEWLLAELTSGGSNRVIAAVSSAEGGRRAAELFTEDCLNLSASFAKAPDQPTAFTALGYTFFRFRKDSALLARKNGLNPDQMGFPTVLDMTIDALLFSALVER